MSDHHIPEHTSLIKTPKQLVIVVLVSFIVPVVVIVMLAHLAIDGTRKPAATAESVAQRIKPVASVVVDPNAPAPVAIAIVAVTAPGAAAPAAAGGDAAKGKSIYDATCMACHAAGVAGAPKAGDKTAWAPRLKTGKDALYASALKGKGAMPPKGGNAGLSDGDIKAAVDYLTGLAK
jgi:cytochrome c5